MTLISQREADEAKEKAVAIRHINDMCRKNLLFENPKCKTLITDGVVKGNPCNDSSFIAKVVSEVIYYDNFTTDNDPHGEHDMGFFEIDATKYMWKFDYYDNELENGSEDPSDPSVTTRVLTILLASEY